MTQGRRSGRARLIGVVLVAFLSACDPFGEPDLSSRDVNAEQAEQVLAQEHIALPDRYEFVAGVVFPVGFVGRPGYDLSYEAPAEVFTDPRPLRSAYTGSTFGLEFPEFRAVGCDAGVLTVARDRKWVACTPETRAKFSTTGNDPTDASHPMYRNSIALVAGDGKTQVIVVLGGS